jgi:hypothetical protein
MLQKEAEKIKKMKKRKMNLVDAEADEEEEEEIAGLEDFGFSTHKKNKNGDDEDEDADDKLDEEDLKHVVDDVSDNEGDEEAGDAARIRQVQKEDKEKHKEILRRMREGYDGRRGGIAGGGAGARGMHRFDQLVAADNREDAKRLGLLNDDELDSDNDGEEKEMDDTKVDVEEDETALLDKMLKDRFLHRSSADLEENFSEEEEEEENDQEKGKQELCSIYACSLLDLLLTCMCLKLTQKMLTTPTMRRKRPRNVLPSDLPSGLGCSVSRNHTPKVKSFLNNDSSMRTKQ